jgi:hypothetical protein
MAEPDAQYSSETRIRCVITNGGKAASPSRGVLFVRQAQPRRGSLPGPRGEAEGAAPGHRHYHGLRNHRRHCTVNETLGLTPQRAT